MVHIKKILNKKYFKTLKNFLFRHISVNFLSSSLLPFSLPLPFPLTSSFLLLPMFKQNS